MLMAFGFVHEQQTLVSQLALHDAVMTGFLPGITLPNR